MVILLQVYLELKTFIMLWGLPLLMIVLVIRYFSQNILDHPESFFRSALRLLYSYAGF